MHPSTSKVLTRLKSGPLTALEALRELGQMRLAARIGEIKAAGYNVRREMIKSNGKRFARYSLR